MCILREDHFNLSPVLRGELTAVGELAEVSVTARVGLFTG